MYTFLYSIITYKDKYDSIGTNGFVTVEPSVVTFKGFEISKLNILKVRVKNTS